MTSDDVSMTSDDVSMTLDDVLMTSDDVMMTSRMQWRNYMGPQGPELRGQAKRTHFQAIYIGRDGDLIGGLFLKLCGGRHSKLRTPML